MHDVSCQFRIEEALKAKSDSTCNSYPELSAASHEMGISLAAQFLNLLLVGAAKTSRPAQRLCTSSAFHHSAGRCDGEMRLWVQAWERHLLSAEHVLIHQPAGNHSECTWAGSAAQPGQQESSSRTPRLARCHRRQLFQDVVKCSLIGGFCCTGVSIHDLTDCASVLWVIRFSPDNSFSCFYLLVIKDCHR